MREGKKEGRRLNGRNKGNKRREGYRRKTGEVKVKEEEGK